MTVECRLKSLPDEIAYVTHADEEEITQISGEKNVVWRILLLDFLDLSTGFMR